MRVTLVHALRFALTMEKLCPESLYLALDLETQIS